MSRPVFKEAPLVKISVNDIEVTPQLKTIIDYLMDNCSSYDLVHKVMVQGGMYLSHDTYVKYGDKHF